MPTKQTTPPLVALIAYLDTVAVGNRIPSRRELCATFGASQRQTAAVLAANLEAGALKRQRNKVLFRTHQAAPSLSAGDVIDLASRGTVGQGGSHWLYRCDVSEGKYRWRKYHVRRSAMVSYVQRNRAKGRAVAVARTRIEGMWSDLDV